MPDGGRDWMETVRRVWAALAGAVGGLWIARVVAWVTGLDGVPLLVLAGALALVGGGVGAVEAHRLPPLTDRDRRDAVIGWGIVGLLVAGVALAAASGFGE